MVSASGIERTLLCPPSAFLPRTRSTTEWADRGNTVDGFVGSVFGGLPIATALRAIEDKETRATCKAIDFKRFGDLGNVRCQVAYAINVRTRTARELGVGIHRQYVELDPDEIPGTLDIEGQERSVEVVDDVKAGYHPVTKCSENAQMAHYRTARMLVTGCSEVLGRICYVRNSGRVIVDEHLFTRFDADAFLDELDEAMERVRKEKRRYLSGAPLRSLHRGEWCDYCGCHAFCPEQVNLARAMLSDLKAISDGDFQARLAELTTDQAGAALRRARDIKDMAETVIRSMKSRAHVEYLPGEPGKVFRPISIERDTFQQGAALELLEKLGATQDQIDSLYEVSVSESVRETNDPRLPKQKKSRPRISSEAT